MNPLSARAGTTHPFSGVSSFAIGTGIAAVTSVFARGTQKELPLKAINGPTAQGVLSVFAW